MRYLLRRKISVIFDVNPDKVANIILSEYFSVVNKMIYVKKLI